jgi:hypothetical protein
VTCFSCRHFCDDPVAVERALPGLAVLSSAHASVRGRDGLCLVHDVVTNGARGCAQFSAAEPAEVAA